MYSEKIVKNEEKMTRLLKATDVAEILNISRSMAYRLMQLGNIPTVRLGKAIRVRSEDLVTYIQANLSSRIQV